MKKTPVGPIAEKKKIKNDPVPLSPGYEDPIKIQRVQREGLTPNSQKFGKLASNNRKGPFKMKGFSGYGTPFKKTTGHGMHPTHGDMNEGMTGAEFETKKEREGRVDEYTRTPSVAETLRERKGEKKRQRPLSFIDRLLGKKQEKN